MQLHTAASIDVNVTIMHMHCPYLSFWWFIMSNLLTLKTFLFCTSSGGL